MDCAENEAFLCARSKLFNVADLKTIGPKPLPPEASGYRESLSRPEASGFREYLGSAEKCLSNYNTENYVGTFHSQCKLFE